MRKSTSWNDTRRLRRMVNLCFLVEDVRKHGLGRIEVEQEFILFDIATFGLVLPEGDRKDIQSTFRGMDDCCCCFSTTGVLTCG